MIKLKSTDSYRAKKRSAVDRTAAEWSHVAKATRRRRKTLPWQDSFLCCRQLCLTQECERAHSFSFFYKPVILNLEFTVINIKCEDGQCNADG